MRWFTAGLVVLLVGVCAVAGQTNHVCLPSKWQAHVHEVRTGPPQEAKGEVAILYMDFENEMFAEREVEWFDISHVRDFYEHKFWFPKNGSMYVYRHFHFGNVSRRECDYVPLTPDHEKPHPPCFTKNGTHHHTEIIGGVVLADVYYHEEHHQHGDHEDTVHGFITLTKTQIPIDHRMWITHGDGHTPTQHELRSYHNFTRNLDPTAFHVPSICF